MDMYRDIAAITDLHIGQFCNNICIVFCLVTNSEYDQNLYDSVLCSIQQELYIERKIQDYDIRTEYIKTITFLSMFDLYIMNTSETEFWGWYLNYNYNYVPIYARNELKESPYFSNIDNIKLIKGRVEETLLVLKNLPKKISILRLDTDFYSSTKVELNILYPRLVKGGVLIIDDYGFWKGARKAVDEYFKNFRPFFHYVDHSCRLMIKS